MLLCTMHAWTIFLFFKSVHIATLEGLYYVMHFNKYFFSLNQIHVWIYNYPIKFHEIDDAESDRN